MEITLVTVDPHTVTFGVIAKLSYFFKRKVNVTLTDTLIIPMVFLKKSLKITSFYSRLPFLMGFFLVKVGLIRRSID